MNKKVLVLMSTYNGEKYIKKQLDTLINQEEVELSILIRDDGSKDMTVKIIKSYIRRFPNIKLILGKNLGYAKSFWYLVLNASEKYDFFAFCDQDDIWLPKKLSRAIELLEEFSDIPCLYTCRVTSIDNNENILSKNCFGTYRALNVYESFIKNILPGCVYVMNRNALKYMKLYNGFLESHDWAAYIIISVFGKVIYDNQSMIYYRIHDNNTIGINNNITLLKKRVKRFFHKSKCTRSQFAKDFYKTYSSYIEDQNLKQKIYFLAMYKTNFFCKLKLIFTSCFKDVKFKFMIIFNKV